MQRRLILAALPLLAAPALAQTGFPSRPIRVVSPFSPGGTSDGVVRLISPMLERLLGQPVGWKTAPAPAAPWARVRP